MNRRAFIRGAGGSLIALPFLESLLAKDARAQATRTPPRMIYLWFDLGVYRDSWIPTGSGTSWQLPPDLQSALGPVKSDIMMVKGVYNLYGDGRNDGPGGHARSIATFLTCAHPRWGNTGTSPSYAYTSASLRLPEPPNVRPRSRSNAEAHDTYHATVYPNPSQGSADQVAARLPWSADYTLKSLQVSTTGGGDSHYDDVRRHLSWIDHDTPAPRFTNPRQVFNQLFANQRVVDAPPDDHTLDVERSILSTVGPTVARLNKRLGREDRAHLDRYLTEIRDIEARLATVQPSTSRAPECAFGEATSYPDDNDSFRTTIDLTLSLMAKAFECDVTRVASFAFPYGSFSFRRDAAGRTLSGEPHNTYSHHDDDPVATAGLRSISVYWAEKLAMFVQDLKSRADVDGKTVLDNSMILFGCGMQDGNAHNSERNDAQLPIILAGRASGAWTPGKLVDTGGRIKLADLHLNMLRNMGYTGGAFGDGDGTSIPL